MLVSKLYYTFFFGNNKVHDTYCKNSKQRYSGCCFKSVLVQHIHSLDSATGEPDSHTHSSHSNESQNHPAQDSLRVKSRERACDLLACPSLHSP